MLKVSPPCPLGISGTTCNTEKKARFIHSVWKSLKKSTFITLQGASEASFVCFKKNFLQVWRFFARIFQIFRKSTFWVKAYIGKNENFEMKYFWWFWNTVGKMAGAMAGVKVKVEEVPMTKMDKLKYGCFVTMVMLLWVSLLGVSLWSLDLVRQNIKIVKDVP